MQRRNVLGLITALGSVGIAGCSGTVDDDDESGQEGEQEQENGEVPEYRDVYEEGTEPDSDVDETALSDLTEFYTAWLHHDMQALGEFLHDPQRLFTDANYVEALSESDPDYDVEIESLNAVLFDDDLTEEEFLGMVRDGYPLSEDDVQEVASTPTREYIVQPELSEEPAPGNELEEQTLQAIQTQTHRIVSKQDDRWKVV